LSTDRRKTSALNRAEGLPLGRKLTYAAMVMVVILIGCEAAVRFRAWMRYGSASANVRDPMMTYDRASGLSVPTPGYEVRGNKINIKINALGFRGDEITREKPANTIRIATLGASTTFCAETSSNHHTWPHRLQERLQLAYPDVTIQVVNAGVAGYVASDSLRNLRHRVMPLQPDLAIYYEANNEIVRDTRELAAREGLTKETTPPELARTLSRYSLLFDLFYKNVVIITGGRADSGRTIDRVPSSLPERFVGVLDEMREELAHRDIPLVLSTFLVKYRRDQDRPTQTANADVAFFYMPWMSIDGMLHAMDTYNDAILAFAARHGLPVVDDRVAVPADDEHFVDCMHLSDRGADAMSQRFFRFLAESGLVDRLVARVKATRVH
jgi:hypothetical protein